MQAVTLQAKGARVVFVTWKAGRPYLQENHRENGKVKSRCTYLGHDPFEARERLAELVDDPARVDEMVTTLEATWSPAGEARRVVAQLKRLYESTCHPEVRMQLALAWDAIEKLAAG